MLNNHNLSTPAMPVPVALESCADPLVDNSAWPREILEFKLFAAQAHDADALVRRAVETIDKALGVECHVLRMPDARLSSQIQDAFVTRRTVVIDGGTAPFGILVIGSREPRTFSRGDLVFAQCIVSILADALRNAHFVRDRARLTTVVGAVHEAIVGIARDGRIFTWNQAAEALLGYEASEVVGGTAAILFATSSTDCLATLLDRVWRDGASVPEAEAILKHRDGGELAASIRFAPIVLPDGRTAAASMIATDLTEKRRADLALRLHGDILTHLPTGVIVWRLNNPDDASSLSLVLANSAAADVVGRPLGALTGAPFGDVMADCGFSDPDLFAAIVRAGTQRDLGERIVTRADGLRRQYHVEAFPLPDRCIAVAFHDVTERRDLSDQLHHAQRLEVVGRLAGTIAHDFNNLLTVIAGYADMLRPAIAGDDSAVDDLRQIEHASRSAQELTRQLLAFSRPQKQKPANVSLGCLVSGMRRMLERLLGEDVRLLVLNQDSATVCVESAQMEQVLLNLAVNARDAMPAGGKLFIETGLTIVRPAGAGDESDLPPGTYAVLQVTDTGIGMDPGTVARIFEPFFTTKSPGKGTGLGLSTVYGIVKQSGGHVAVRSEVGEGTTFRIYLPATDVAVDVAGDDEPTPVSAAAASRTLLLVDDDEGVRSLMQRILTGVGYTVLSAGGPIEALELARRFTGTIDLLLTDVVMPVQSGAELAARLAVTFPEMRALFMSGYVPESHGHRALPKGATLLHKPMTPGQLLDGVRRALEGTRNKADAVGQPLM